MNKAPGFARIATLIAACALVLGSAISAVGAEKPVPPSPYYYVLDEASVLSPDTVRALQTLLIEHDRVTGEKFMIAIFKSLNGENLETYTHQIFTQWKIGERGGGNGALLALYMDDRKAKIEAGFGLESVLTDAEAKTVINDVLFPELKNNQPNGAVVLATIEILRALGSPLLQNGKADTILRAAGFSGNLSVQPGTGLTIWPWMVLGFILLALMLNFFHAAEAHFSGTGWKTVRPLDFYRIQRRRTQAFEGGGSAGSWR
jgi:uncharacterized protein